MVGQTNGNIPDWNINDEEVRLQRGDHRDVGQTLDADWPSPIFPRHHPSGFAAVNAEEAHGFQSNGSGTDRRKKGRSDQAVPYAPMLSNHGTFGNLFRFIAPTKSARLS